MTSPVIGILTWSGQVQDSTVKRNGGACGTDSQDASQEGEVRGQRPIHCSPTISLCTARWFTVQPCAADDEQDVAYKAPCISPVVSTNRRRRPGSARRTSAATEGCVRSVLETSSTAAKRRRGASTPQWRVTASHCTRPYRHASIVCRGDRRWVHTPPKSSPPAANSRRLADDRTSSTRRIGRADSSAACLFRPPAVWRSYRHSAARGAATCCVLICVTFVVLTRTTSAGVNHASIDTIMSPSCSL